jgi:cell division septal protein FtsQ
VAARRRTTSRLAVLPARPQLPAIGRLLPSVRSLAVGIGLVLFALLAYFVARDTSLFAMQTVDVRGGTPQVRAEVAGALHDEVGTSLLRVGDADLTRRLDALPDVAWFSYDRSFPHTLKIVVRAEVPSLVVRQVPGKQGYLVAATGRVLRPLPNPGLSHLPRLWVTHAVSVEVGQYLPTKVAGSAAAAAIARSIHLPGGVSTVAPAPSGLTLTLGNGVQVRLGDIGDLRLKLAIAKRILRILGGPAATGYVDVSLPERPVADSDPQVSH